MIGQSTSEEARRRNAAKAIAAGKGPKVRTVDGKHVLDPNKPLECARAFSPRDGGLRYLKGDFYEWKQSRYAALNDDDIRSDLYRFLDEVLRPGPRGGVCPFDPNKAKVENVLHALRGECNVRSEINPPAWIGDGAGGGPFMACTNGLLCLRSLKLLPHSPDYFNTTAVDFAYDPNAPKPKEWLKFLNTVWPGDANARSITTLQEMMGYLVSGDNRLGKVFLISGPKRSGKGTIGRVLVRLIGSGGHIGLTLRSLATGDFPLQPLINKSLALIPDARLQTRSHNIVEAILAISGGDHLTINRKFKTAWTGLLPTRFLFLTNVVPELHDPSGVIASRFITLETAISFFGREDLGLDARLMVELPGILNWSIAGWRRLMERGHFNPPKTESARLIEELASPVAAFVEECCELDPLAQTITTTLYQAYQMWCAKHGRFAGNDASFGADLNALYQGEIVKKSHKGPPFYRTYDGIRLTAAEAPM